MKPFHPSIPAGLVASVVAVALLGGCGPNSTPPGPTTSFGMVEPGAHFEFLLWDEGLAVLLADNITADHQTSGRSSTRDPVYRQSGTATSKEGLVYRWRVETRDGIEGEIEIDGRAYDLAEGAVFSVTVGEAGTTVEPLDLDLSQLSSVDDCRAFIAANRGALKIGGGGAVEAAGEK